MQNTMLDFLPRYTHAGVYGLHNVTKDLWYIGSSSNVWYRVRAHLNALNRNSHYNGRLQEDWNGGDSFQAILLEATQSNNRCKLLGYERQYHDIFHTSTNGYNRQLPNDWINIPWMEGEHPIVKRGRTINK